MAERLIVAITGASGFIGKHLVHHLDAQGFEIIPITRSEGFDICDEKSLESIPKFDVMVHLAAKTFVPTSFEKPSIVLHDNFVGTLNVLDLCRKNNASMLFASSYIYGAPNKLPVDEDHPVNHWNPYASSKLLCEQLCKSYSINFDVDVRVLRFFNIFGSGQSENFLIPTIIKGLHDGALSLQTSKPRRDFLHVNDLVDLLETCVTNQVQGYEIFNVGSGISYSVAEIVEMATEIGNKQNVPVTYSNIERKADVLDVVADCTKISNALEWKPKLSIGDGLRLTMENDV